MKPYSIYMEQWQRTLSELLDIYDIYAPIQRENYLDYELITADSITDIVYNQARPITPLKTFFFPIKENVALDKTFRKKRIILGVPACDLAGLELMDKIFLDEQFLDIFYKRYRENTILIGADCFNILETCHCVAYDIKPYPTENCDASISLLEDRIILETMSEKGEELVSNINPELIFKGEVNIEIRRNKRLITENMLKNRNVNLPDSQVTAALVLKPDEEIWKKYAQKCVSCGACAAICPTCHCFLLIDRENFEKVKNWDTCQYPAFEKVAAGEDPLGKLYKRLKNRYLCKFVHKPSMFDAIACTGCGRCIDACIGKIDKNELIMELKEYYQG